MSDNDETRRKAHVLADKFFDVIEGEENYEAIMIALLALLGVVTQKMPLLDRRKLIAAITALENARRY